MNRELRLSASLLNADPLRLAEAVVGVAGEVDTFHVDVMDGRFAGNFFGSVAMVRRLRELVDTPVECHLMVDDPGSMAKGFAEAGADRIIVHVEAAPASSLRVLLSDLKSLGVRTSLAILPQTPIDELLSLVHLIDSVLVVTVPTPGFGKQRLIEDPWQRIATVRATIREYADDVEVSVDGGIREENVQLAVRAGATGLVIGSAAFEASSPAQRLRSLRVRAVEAAWPMSGIDPATRAESNLKERV